MKKNRMIPIGSRAVMWIQKYIDEVRPYLVREPDDGTLFLTRHELTHPAAKLERRADRDRGNDEARDELLSSLAAEASEEEHGLSAPMLPAKRPQSG